MKKINIVMIEPQIPQNTGNVARTCAATGAKLHLVEPMGFEINDKNLKRAGLDYWNLLDVCVYSDIDDFFKRNEGNFFYFSTKAKNKYTDIVYPDECYLVFGKETAGIDEKILYKNKEKSVRIPMIDQARSLNLANTVAIGVYEVLRQWNYPNLLCKGKLRNYSD